MNMNESLSTIFQYFNDFIAHVLPGALLLVSLAASIDFYRNTEILTIIQNFQWPYILGVSFVLGHIVLSLKLPLIIKEQQPQLESDLLKNKVVQDFGDLYRSTFSSKSNIAQYTIHEQRNIAMSVSSSASDIGQRFMFISLFCLAVSRVLQIISIFIFVLAACTQHIQTFTATLPISALILYFSHLLQQRKVEFHNRSMLTPFTIAIHNIDKLEKSK